MTAKQMEGRSNISVYTSSWNMGEKSSFTVAEAERWIPRGYDIYGIGVQECLITDAVKSKLHLSQLLWRGSLYVEICFLLQRLYMLILGMTMRSLITA